MAKGYNLEQTGPQVQEAINKSLNLTTATQSKEGLMSAQDKQKLDSLDSELAGKVDKVPGKGLSTNDYDNTEKGKVASAYQKPVDGIPASDLAEGVIPDTSQFITKTVNDLANYYLKTETYSRSETYTKTEVDALIALIKQFTYQVVSELPEASESTMYKLYLVPSADPQTQNVKDEYITVRSGSEGAYTYAWEQIGSTAIDLSGYVTTQALNAALANYTTTANLTTLLAAKQDVIADLSTIRSGAAAGATAYQKPGTGIPKTDLESGVQQSLDLADSAIQAEPTGVDVPVEPSLYATKEEVDELEHKVDDIVEGFPNENLYDKSQNVGGYVKSDGTFVDNSSGDYYASPQIDIEENTYYYLQGRDQANSMNIRCFDENNNPIKVRVASDNTEYSTWALPKEDGSGAAMNGQFKTPAGAKKVQFNIIFGGAGTDTYVMLSKIGTTYVPNIAAPAFVPFGYNYKVAEDALPESLTEDLAQLDDDVADLNAMASDVIETKASPNLFDKGQTLNTGYIDSSGTISGTNPDYKYSYMIPVIGGHYYYLSGRNITTSSNIRCLSSAYSPMKVRIASTGEEYTTWSLPNETGDGGTYNGQFKAPDTAAYVQFNVTWNGVGDANAIMLEDLGTQYIPGRTAPTYVPYDQVSYAVKESALPDGYGNDSLLSLMRGKSIRIFGGSVAKLCNDFGGVTVMQNLLGVNILDSAVSGGGYAKDTTISGGVPSFAVGSIPAQVNAATTSGQPKYDVYVLWSSTNDTGNEVGEATDYTYFDNYDVSKLVNQNGGMNYCIKKLQEFAPEAHIIIVGSMKAFDWGAGLSTKMKQLVDGQEQVALLQSCPFFSLWANAGVNFYNKDTFFTWTVENEGESRNDGTHPNSWAYQNVIGPKIAKQIALLY